MENRKLSNTGDFRTRIVNNVVNGYKYPKAVVTKTIGVGGNSGNITEYWFFNGTEFEGLATIPDWGRGTKSGKYADANCKVKEYQNKYPTFGIQQFITQRN